MVIDYVNGHPKARPEVKKRLQEAMDILEGVK